MADNYLPELPNHYPQCTRGRDGYACDGVLLPFHLFDGELFRGFAWKCERCGKVVRLDANPIE